MMTHKLILKATAALALVGLSGGLLAEQPKKNEQRVYRGIEHSAKRLGKIAAYTTQTKINVLNKLLNNRLGAFASGVVAYSILRPTLFSIEPKTDLKSIAKSVCIQNKHDAKQAIENLTIGYANLAKWIAPKAEKAQVVAKEVTQQANEKYGALQRNKTFQEVSKRTQEAKKSASVWATDKATALAKWFKNLGK